MNQFNDALSILGGWLAAIVAFLASIFDVIEGALRQVLSQIGVPGGIQSLVVLLVAVLFIVAVLRLFGGLLRILLLVFFILLLLHVLLPNVGF